MIKICIVFLAASPALAGCRPAGSAAAPGRRPVTVFAAASLREALSEATATWSRRGGRPVRVVCDASSILGRQLAEGAKADIFIPADPEWLESLALLDRRDWAGNRLVAVVRKDAAGADLRSAASLALAGEQVPAGKYARAALAHLGIPLPARTILGSSVRDVLSKVSEGGAEAGIVYATDAAIDPGVRIALEFPADSHPPIRYPAGLLTREGKEFFEALFEPWAREVARRHGFQEPP